MLSSLTALVGPVTNLLDQFVEDKDKKNELAHQIATMADKHHQEIMLAQIAVNKEEAKGNWFQSSWRPATAWVCVAGFAVNFLISPLAAPFGIEVPQADTTVMLPVLMGMLGLAGARSYERVKNVGK
ncbi:holin family protein [Flavobacteriaceae bacterium]|nr:holin family protein [Flavobacteriaceae bacterium]